MRTNKQKAKLILKTANKQKTRAMKKPYLSKDWNEGENIKIDGLDRNLRMQMDNVNGGPRWHPRQSFHNRMVKTKIRGDVTSN